MNAVYISYAEEDAMYASLLSDALKEYNIKSLEFSYEDNYNFHPEFQTKLKRIEYFIPIISSFWKKNIRAQMEYGVSAAQKKNILPLILENNDTNLPFKLNYFINASKINVASVAKKIATNQFDVKKPKTSTKNEDWKLPGKAVPAVYKFNDKIEKITISNLINQQQLAEETEYISAVDIIDIDLAEAIEIITDKIKYTVVESQNGSGKKLLFICDFPDNNSLAVNKPIKVLKPAIRNTSSNKS